MSVVDVLVTTAGLATVQDLGRPGLAAMGVAANGAADAYAARVANVLVGNPPGAPHVEVTGSEFGFTADCDLLVAVTGAADGVTVGGARQPAWETVVVPAGAAVHVQAPRRGWRTSVAFGGALDAEVLLGSVAPDRLLGVGRTLRAGDRLRLRTDFAGLTHPHSGIPVFRLGPAPPRSGSPLVVETTTGPDAADFPDQADGRLPVAYAVAPESDTVGLRLVGPTPKRASERGILSRGVPVGAVEVPPGGGLLVLLRGRLVTAGYPVLAVATSVGVDVLGQARPGDELCFDLVDVQRAQQSYRARERDLSALADRVARAFGTLGLATT